MFKLIFIITNLAYFFFIHNSLQLPREKNRGCCSTLSTPCSRAPVMSTVIYYAFLFKIFFLFKIKQSKEQVSYHLL